MTSELRAPEPFATVLDRLEAMPQVCLECVGCGAELIHRFGPPPERPECESCARARAKAEEEQRHREERESRARRLPALLVAAGVPAQYRHASRESWDAGHYPWPTIADTWAGNPQMLLFWGPSGAGKTHVATAVLRRWLLETGPGPVWISTSALIQGLKSEFGRRPEDGGLLERVTHAPLLLLDELAARADGWKEGERNAWLVEQFRLLIDERYGHQRPTLFTTNRSPTWLTERNPPLASRVLSGWVKEMRAEDYRFRLSVRRNRERS